MVAQARDFSPSQSVQINSGAQPTSYSIETQGYFPTLVKEMGHECDHSPPFSDKVKNK